MPIVFPLPPEGETFALGCDMDSVTTELQSLDNTLNVVHIPTDRFRWQDLYNSQYSQYLNDVKSQGLKVDEENIETITQGSPYTVTAPQGGLLTVRAINESGGYTSVSILNQAGWSSNGMPEGIIITKYFNLLNGDVVQVDAAQSATFSPSIEDPTNALRISLDKMQGEIAVNKLAILDLKAGIENKQPSGIKTDIANTTYTVNNSLGGRITGKGLNLILGSKGIVTVQDTNGTREVYNNSGLLSLLDPVPVLVADVADEAVVTSSGMGELTFETYVQG